MADRRSGSTLVPHIFLILGAVVMVGPFVWEVLTSFKTFAESIHVPPVAIPSNFDLRNYREVFDSLPFSNLFVNTVLMTLRRRCSSARWPGTRSRVWSSRDADSSSACSCRS